MFQPLSFIVILSSLALTAAAISAQAPVGAAKPEVSATLSVRNAGTWKSLDSGIEYRTITLERSEPSYSLDFKLIRFDTRQVSPRIISSSQFQLKSGDAQTLAERSGAIAAINANYFDEKGKPLAFLKSAAQDINRSLSKHALYTGVFGVRDSIPFITHRNDFRPAEAQEALQSGPLLLNHGEIVQAMPGLGRYSRRAVIGVDKQQSLIIGVTDTLLGGLSFAELQELFSNPRWQLQTPDLLNLDGGGSAQLYIKTRTLKEFISGTTEVPVVIGFFKKRS
ncbi:MAG: phosphodiester glycosidase family protein [Candidatus Binatia bacterium]